MADLSKRVAGISPSPTLAIDAKAKALAEKGVEVINLSAGAPDFDTPEHIKHAARRALDEGFTKYTPVSGIQELKKAVAASLGSARHCLRRAAGDNILWSEARVVQRVAVIV